MDGILDSSKGFGLIELIMAMVILGFSLTSLVKLYADLTFFSVQPDFRQRQITIAQETMEEVRSKQYDHLTVISADGNWSTTLGPESGETTTDDFNDVDDYEGFSEVMTNPYAGFTRSVEVDYVAYGALDTPIAIPSPITTDWCADKAKRVVVTVSNTGITDYQMVSILTEARSREYLY